MIKYVWITEMTDPIFHWKKIENLAAINEPLIVYSKAKVPIDFFCDNPQIGLNLTISGWGNTWLEPNVPNANEMIDHLNEVISKIIKRGLFQSSIGKRINADVNGSLNILRKVAGNVFLSSRGFVVNPVKISCGFTKSLVEFL